MDNYNFNINPHLLAAILIESSLFSKEEIQINLDESNQKERLKSIVQLKRSEKTGTLQIFTKNESKERHMLLTELQNSSTFKILTETFEESLAQFIIELSLSERKHLLGTSDFETYFFNLLPSLTGEEKKIMAFFLPWLSLIRGDMELTKYCFESAIGYPVTLSLTPPKEEMVEGLIINKWVTDSTDIVGGIRQQDKPNVKIEIGPVDLENFEALQPGRSKRRFLEKSFFPTFLSEDWTWEVLIELQKEETNNCEMINLCNNYYIP